MQQDIEEKQLLGNKNKKQRFTDADDEEPTENIQVSKQIEYQDKQKGQNQISEGIMSIISSSTFSDQQKAEQLNHQFVELRNIDNSQLQETFKQINWKYLLSIIDKCNTLTEKAILQIVDFSFLKMQYLIYKGIQISSNLKNIKSLIEQKINQEDQENSSNGERPYSDLLEQIVRIYSIMMREREIPKAMLNICLKILYRNLTVFQNRFIQYREQLEEMEINEIEQKEFEKQLFCASASIRAVGQIRFNDDRSIAREHTTLGKQTQQRVLSFLHINCANELHCPQIIAIQSSYYIEELSNAVYDTLSMISLRNSNFSKILDTDHNFFHHLAIHIKFISSQQSLSQQQLHGLSEQRPHGQYFPPLTIIQALIDKIENSNTKEFYNNNKITNFETPDEISALIVLCKLKINSNMNQQQKNQTNQIKHICLNCLSRIESFPLKNEQQKLQLHNQLLTQGYIQLLIMSICTVNGNRQQGENETQHRLKIISNFLNELYQEEKLPIQNYPPFPQVAKQTIEEIEEEGAIEEIEAIPATQQYRWFFGFVDRTIETQNAILNLYVDFSNYKQRF